MKQSILFLLFFIKIATSIFAQNIQPPTLFAAASAHAQANNFGTLDWSIGETIVASFDAGSGDKLTQGFHQVFITIATPTENLPENADFSVKIFPNPTTGWVNIAAEKAVRTRIFDISGKEIVAATGFSENPTLDLSQLSSGLFFLEILNEGQLNARVFKLEVVK
jgi:hypothetical protein